MIKGIKPLFLLLFLAVSGFAFTQDSIFRKLILSLQGYTEHNYQEKVYLRTDTDTYYAGDILWFNTRLLDAQSHLPSKRSKIVHVKLYNANNQELYHRKIKVEKGNGYGDILLADTLSTGIYYIKGYTEWMKNFSPELFFQRQIYIVNKPVPLNVDLKQEREEVSVDFFPEGGSIVESLPNNIGFKVLNDKGLSVDIEGFIVDDRQDTLMPVSTYKFGIGSFLLTPKNKRTYYLLTTHQGAIKKYQLPYAQKEGVSLMVKSNNSDNVGVKLAVSRSIRKQTSKLILLSHCRGKVNFAAEGNATANVSEVDIPKTRLNPGINHLTVFTETGLPLAERLIFIQPELSPPLQVEGLKETYRQKDLVEIQLDSKLAETLNVSVSVHDRPFRSNVNIQNYLLLTSDLKGNVENPEYYFTSSDSAVQAADNLMLTQGWRRFVWQDVLDEKRENLPYLAESEGLIFRGKLINKQTGKAVTDTLLILSVMDRHPNFVFNRLSGTDEMLFAFYDMHGKYKVYVNILGEAAYHNYLLVAAEDYDTSSMFFPKSKSADLARSLNKHFEWKQKDDVILNNYLTYEPELFSVPDPKLIKDEFFLNQLFSPNHDLDPDQYIPLQNLKEMIFELVPSAKVKTRKGTSQVHVLAIEPLFEKTPDDFNKEPATIFLNGVPVFDHELIFNLPYENIDKIEVFTGQYVFDKHTFHGFFSVITKDIHSDKSILANTSNSIEFEGLSFRREYYSPRYHTDDSAEKRIPDLRHLLHWEPNLLIGKDGKATITFYTSDVLNEFYVSIEGITNTGIPVHIQKKFTTKPKL